jgi:hypothetical protein
MTYLFIINLFVEILEILLENYNKKSVFSIIWKFKIINIFFIIINPMYLMKNNKLNIFIMYIFAINIIKSI